MWSVLLTVISSLLIANLRLSLADDCKKIDFEKNTSKLHHITEFGKRSKVLKNDCKNTSSPKTNVSVLGLHGLLHASSQKKLMQNITFERKDKTMENDTFEKPKHEAGSKRSSAELHKLKLKTETISMLHAIVEKYFPGGNLTVMQKIKALKILGKLIKLKKEGKNSDIKKLLSTLSAHQQRKNDSDISKSTKLKAKLDKSEKSGKKGETGDGSDGDIYANIASGPDVPKLPPSVTDKDPDHEHSNIMPVGLQPLPGETRSDLMSTISRQSDNDRFNDRISSYQALLGGYQGDMGRGVTYGNDNSYFRTGMDLSSIPSWMDSQGYARSRMPYTRGYANADLFRHRNPYFRYDDDDYEDDDDEDDEDQEDRERSYVHRDRFYDDDDEDGDDVDNNDDEYEFSRRFDRKNKIAKSSDSLKPKSNKKN